MNPSGAPSAPFQLQVGNGSSTPEKPAIATITPTSTTKGTQAQPVTITGTHFDASSSLQVTAPDGSAAQVSGFVVTSSTSIQCAVVFNETGTYSVTVVTSGGLSNSVQVSVSGL